MRNSKTRGQVRGQVPEEIDLAHSGDSRWRRRAPNLLTRSDPRRDKEELGEGGEGAGELIQKDDGLEGSSTLRGAWTQCLGPQGTLDSRPGGEPGVRPRHREGD